MIGCRRALGGGALAAGWACASASRLGGERAFAMSTPPAEDLIASSHSQSDHKRRYKNHQALAFVDDFRVTSLIGHGSPRLLLGRVCVCVCRDLACVCRDPPRSLTRAVSCAGLLCACPALLFFSVFALHFLSHATTLAYIHITHVCTIYTITHVLSHCTHAQARYSPRAASIDRRRPSSQCGDPTPPH